MPNTTPVNDLPAITRWMQDPERGALVNVFPIAAATRGSQGEKLTNYAELKRAGAVAVSDDGKPILNDELMRKALETARKLGIPVIQHAEDTRISKNNPMHEGEIAFRLGLRGQPAESEWRLVERDVTLARQTEAHVHVAHVSTAITLEVVREARQSGVEVTCEVTPHHFMFTDAELLGYDTNFKMNPPLRGEADRQALLRGLLDGTVDCIATDHAPHARFEKYVEFDRAAFGITGLEIAFGVACTVLHQQNKMPLAQLVRLFSVNRGQNREARRARNAGARRARRRDHLRSQEALEVRFEQNALEIAERAVGRNQHDRTRDLHHCRRARGVRSLMRRTTGFGGFCIS